MKDINVKIKRIIIINFSAREGSVEFVVYFNDYKTIKNVVIDDPEELAYDLVTEIRRKVKDVNQRPDSDNILDTIVNVLIEDEESTIKKITMFLGKLADRINAIQNTTQAENYMDSINTVKSMVLEL
jgi:glucose-6-phosphate dehydrogenase assembly protein OpcA|tara:strand:- start:342 stop:722 length:381 start_codon:yes stop_codon:yes gene_type:complete